MKKILSIFFAILLVFNIAAVTFAIAPPYVSSVSINADGIITMNVGDEITLEAVAEPQGYRYAYMVWGTNDEDIVTISGFDGTTKLEPPVSSAKLTALVEGSCVVTAYASLSQNPAKEEWIKHDSVTIRVLPKESTEKGITYTLNISLPEIDEVDVPFTVHVDTDGTSYSKHGIIPAGKIGTTLKVEELPIARKYATRVEFGYHKYKNAYLEDVDFFQPIDFSTDYTAEYSTEIICNVSLPEGYITENNIIVKVTLSTYTSSGSVIVKDEFLEWEDTKTIILNQATPMQQIILYTQTDPAMLSYNVIDVPDDLCQKGYLGTKETTVSEQLFSKKISESCTTELKLLREKTVTATLARPFSLPNDTNVYGKVILFSINSKQKYILNQTDIPLIPAGEYSVKVNFRMPEDESFYLYITDVCGDDHIFEYCNYSYGTSVGVDKSLFRPILYSSGNIELVLSRCNIVTGKIESNIPDLSFSALATCRLFDGKTIYLPASVEDGMFSLKIPEDTDYYVLDVQTDVGVKSYYISDGISTNEEDDATKIYFEYNDDREVVMQYFVQNPALPIILSSNIRENKIEIVHVSDYPLGAFDVYIAYYNRDGSLNSVEKIEDIVLQGGRHKTYPISVNDYRIQTAKVFAWENNGMVPLSNGIDIPISQLSQRYFPEQNLSVFTAGDTNAVINCKNEVLSTAPRIINDTIYLSAVDFERLGYLITEHSNRVYIENKREIFRFTVGEYAAILDEYNIRYELSAPILQEENVLLIPITIICDLFAENVYWDSSNQKVFLNKPFSDVDYENVYFEAILDMYYNGIILGYEDGTFHPNHILMRSEVARIFSLSMGYDYNKYVFSCSDVPLDYWAKSYIGICINEGIFQLKDDCFRPEDYTTVEEAVEATLNMVGAPYENSIETAKEIGLMTHIGTENTSRNITRAELMQLLYNAKQL